MLIYDSKIHCFYCGEYGSTIEHLVPQCRHGGDWPHNLVMACLSCNSAKKHHSVDAYRKIIKEKYGLSADDSLEFAGEHTVSNPNHYHADALNTSRVISKKDRLDRSRKGFNPECTNQKIKK